MFALGFIPYLPLFCSALYLWPLASVDLLVSSLCCWLPAGFLTWDPNKRSESGKKGEAGYFPITAFVHNSECGCISSMIPLPTKRASHRPASIHPVTLTSGPTLSPSHSFLLSIFPVTAFFYLDFSALPSTV